MRLSLRCGQPLQVTPQQAQEARERAAQAISRAQSIPIEQARTRVQQYEQQYRQSVDTAKQQATEAAEVAATAVSRGALFGSLALLLGAAAGWWGGRMGAVEPTITTRLGLTEATVPERAATVVVEKDGKPPITSDSSAADTLSRRS